MLSLYFSSAAASSAWFNWFPAYIRPWKLSVIQLKSLFHLFVPPELK